MENSEKKIPIFKWKRIEKTIGPIPRPRHGHRAVAIKDLMVVFGGGNEGMHDGLHVFNTATEQWFLPPMKGNCSPGRAGFGFVVDNTRIIVFGGMLEYGECSNDIYELQATKWEWKYLRPRNSPGQRIPCVRLGHSFNLVDKKVFMFGGLSFGRDGAQTKYLNDLFMLDLLSDGSVVWDQPYVIGLIPPPRESHSAVTYQDKFGRYKLVVYGGMNGTNRLGDLWTLHLCTMQWTKEIVFGNAPLPRSLHSATVVAHRMFVFGGWVPLLPDEKSTETFFGNGEWQCSNQLACLNLESMVWEELLIDTPEENLPKSRAGHSAVAMNSRIYIWSGRDGYKKAWNNQVCCKDLWYLEVEKPVSVGRIQLLQSSVDCLEVKWDKISCIDHYILQIQPNANLPMEKSQTYGDISNYPPPSFVIGLTPKYNSIQEVKPSFLTANFDNSTKSSYFHPQVPLTLDKPLMISETQLILSQTPKTVSDLSSQTPVQSSSSTQLLTPSLQSFQKSSEQVNPDNLVTSLLPEPSNLEKMPNSCSKPSLSPAIEKAQPLPLVITVPPDLPKKQALTYPLASYTLASNNSAKSMTSHIPVSAVPTHFQSNFSRFQTVPEVNGRGPLLSTESASRQDQALAANVPSLLESTPQEPYTCADKLAPNAMAQGIHTDSRPQSSANENSDSVMSNQSSDTQHTAAYTTHTSGSKQIKINPRPVTIVTPSQLSTLTAGKPIRVNFKKIPKPSSKTTCVIVQKGQQSTAKENIPKILQSSQEVQPRSKVVYKLVRKSQGPPGNVLRLSGSSKQPTFVFSKPSSTNSPSSFLPGTRLITIKRPLTIDMTKDLITQPVAAAVSGALASSQEVPLVDELNTSASYHRPFVILKSTKVAQNPAMEKNQNVTTSLPSVSNVTNAKRTHDSCEEDSENTN